MSASSLPPQLQQGNIESHIDALRKTIDTNWSVEIQKAINVRVIELLAELVAEVWKSGEPQGGAGTFSEKETEVSSTRITSSAPPSLNPPNRPLFPLPATPKPEIPRVPSPPPPDFESLSKRFTYSTKYLYRVHSADAQTIYSPLVGFTARVAVSFPPSHYAGFSLAARNHLNWSRTSPPSPLISTTTDLVRAISIAQRYENERKSSIIIVAIDATRIPEGYMWNAHTLLNDHRAKTEVLVWQAIPKSAIVGVVDWSKLRRKDELGALMPEVLQIREPRWVPVAKVREGIDERFMSGVKGQGVVRKIADIVVGELGIRGDGEGGDYGWVVFFVGVLMGWWSGTRCEHGWDSSTRWGNGMGPGGNVGCLDGEEGVEMVWRAVREAERACPRIREEAGEDKGNTASIPTPGILEPPTTSVTPAVQKAQEGPKASAESAQTSKPGANLVFGQSSTSTQNTQLGTIGIEPISHPPRAPNTTIATPSGLNTVVTQKDSQPTTIKPAISSTTKSLPFGITADRSPEPASTATKPPPSSVGTSKDDSTPSKPPPFANYMSGSHKTADNPFGVPFGSASDKTSPFGNLPKPIDSSASAGSTPALVSTPKTAPFSHIGFGRTSDPKIPSPFGSSPAPSGSSASTGSTSTLGQNPPPSTTAQKDFGELPPSGAVPNPNPSPAFGVASSNTSTRPFGAAPNPNPPPAFGAASSGAAASPFGVTPNPNPASAFGKPAFGAASPNTTTSPFGTPTSTTTTGAPQFGGPSLVSGASISGFTASPFGTPSSSSTAAFGKPNFGGGFGAFGSSSTSTGASPFGQSAVGQQGSQSAFGNPSSSIVPRSSAFGKLNSSTSNVNPWKPAFGNSTPNSSTPGTASGQAGKESSFGKPSPFGGATATAGVSAASPSVFGAATASGTPTAASPFGQPATFGNTLSSSATSTSTSQVTPPTFFKPTPHFGATTSTPTANAVTSAPVFQPFPALSFDTSKTPFDFEKTRAELDAAWKKVEESLLQIGKTGSGGRSSRQNSQRSENDGKAEEKKQQQQQEGEKKKEDEWEDERIFELTLNFPKIRQRGRRRGRTYRDGQGRAVFASSRKWIGTRF